MSMKPALPYKRNPIENAATQAKDGPMNKKIENAQTSTTPSTKNPIRNAKTNRK